uniref:Uncharacterized protein n=1 Tax=Rhizophora mucronata TaxID=61149 RepID=A0A2P2QEY3_RHIMU
MILFNLTELLISSEAEFMTFRLFLSSETWEWNCNLNEKTLSFDSSCGTFINSRKNCSHFPKFSLSPI